MRPGSSSRLLPLLLLLPLAFACFGSMAQSPAPLSTPNLQLHSAGQVLASTVLSDGSLIIGGTFQSLNGVSRLNLAKFAPNGALDPNWTPAVGPSSGTVNAIVVDGSGNIYIGGSFTSVNGVSQSTLARLKPDGTLDNAWSPTLDGQNNSVLALALDGTGNLFAGGLLSAGDFGIFNLAKISTTDAGTVDLNWNPFPDAAVRSLVYDGAGNLFVGGDFSGIGSQAYANLAKISTSGAGDANAPWNPNTDGLANIYSVTSLAISGSTLFVGGAFTHLGGQTRNSIAKLSTTGTGDADATWDPNVRYLAYLGDIDSLALDSSGHIYVSGLFSTIGGNSLTNLAKLSTSGAGASDSSWNPQASLNVYTLAPVPSGNVYVGGTFTYIAGGLHLGFAQIDTSGNVVSSTPDAEELGYVLAIAPLSDGATIVGGGFLKVGNTQRPNILRLQADGTLDATWNAAADQPVKSLAADGAGSVYAGGHFGSIGGLARSRIAKLSVSGTGAADPTWNPNADDDVNALALDGSGNLYAGGFFGNIGGRALLNLAKLSTAGAGAADATWGAITVQNEVDRLVLDGAFLYAAGYLYFCYHDPADTTHPDSCNLTVENDLLARFATSGVGFGDPSWNPAPSNSIPFAPLSVSALWPDGNGSIYIGGSFDQVGGLARNNIAKLSTSASATADATWNPAADGAVADLLPDGAGNLYVAGSFASIGGQPRNRTAKLSLAGTGVADANWNPSPDNDISVIEQSVSGNILLGGTFAHFGTEPRVGLAAFAPDVIFSNGFD